MLLLHENMNLQNKQLISNKGGFKNINKSLLEKNDINFLKNLNEVKDEIIIKQQFKLSSIGLKNLKSKFNIFNNIDELYEIQKIKFKNFTLECGIFVEFSLNNILIIEKIFKDSLTPPKIYLEGSICELMFNEQDIYNHLKKLIKKKVILLDSIYCIHKVFIFNDKLCSIIENHVFIKII
jgi:hypothetical protein